MIDNEHFNFVDNVEIVKKDIEAIQKEIFNKMAIPKDIFQVKTVIKTQKKQTLTYKIKNFFKNILKFKKIVINFAENDRRIIRLVKKRIHLF